MSIRKDEVFFYVLDYFPNKVVFNVVNVETKSRKFNVYSTDYNPLKKSHISKLLRKSGFKYFKCFGNYKLKKFNIKNDDILVFICEK